MDFARDKAVGDVKVRIAVVIEVPGFAAPIPAAKARAGFSIYAMKEDMGPLRRAIADPGLTKEIYSL